MGTLKFEDLKKKKTYMANVVIPAFQNAKLDPGRMSECGEYVYAVECQNCHTNHFSGFSRCKSRWCVSCNHVRTLAWLARIIPVVSEFRANGGYIGKLNLTIKNTDTLEDGLKILGNSWRNFSNGNGNRKRFKETFVGGIRSLEVTVGEDLKWHPHYHCLIMQDRYNKDFEWLREKWETSTCISAGVKDEKIGSVWLQGIYDDGRGVLKGIIEVVKYITDSETQWFHPLMKSYLQEAYFNLKGVRQMNTWGLLYGLSAKVEEDLETLNEKKLTEFICQSCGCTEGELVRLMYSDNLSLIDLPRL